MNNQTSVSSFQLLQFSEAQELQILLFLVFLVSYLMSVTGNLLIIITVAFDHRLHTPMYIFLTNLAVMDLGSTSAVIPKAMSNALLNSRSITYYGCVAQVLFYIFFVASDFSLLIAMSYDRYVAICNPLQYERIMHKGACIRMIVIVWGFSAFYASLHTGGTFANTFCSNVIHQFFCEIPALLKLACTDIYLIEIGNIVFSCSLALGYFIYIVITYMLIFSTVLKIPSLQGKKKALSTCLPHLAVVSMFTCTILFTYAKPPTNSSSDLDVVSAAIYTIIPPMLNPFIYSIRNKDIKTALWKLLASALGKDTNRQVAL